MKNRVSGILVTGLIVASLAGCGAKTEAADQAPEDSNVVEAETENKNKEIEGNTEDTNTFAGAENEDIDSLITEKNDSELDLKEYYYSFEDRTAGSTGEEVFSRCVFEDVGDGSYYETTGKVSLYAPNGVRMGYMKENVDFSVMAACGDWCRFYLDSEIRYARLSDIEANSLGPEELDAISAEIIAEEMAKAQPKSETTIPAEQNPSQGNVSDTAAEEPVSATATSDKYTPEEAIAVYREILEAGGITWDPSLKDVSSWGTGFLYLEKGYAEQAGQSSLESAAYGDGVKHFLDKYYLEVTGYDEDCVYYTKWHN